VSCAAALRSGRRQSRALASAQPPCPRATTPLAQATASFSQDVILFGHGRFLGDEPIHLMALLVYDLTDDAVVTYRVARGDDTFNTPLSLQSLNATQGHYYHVLVSNMKTRWMGEAYRFKDAQVKIFSDILWGTTSPPAYNSSVLVVPYARAPVT